MPDRSHRPAPRSVARRIWRALAFAPLLLLLAPVGGTAESPMPAELVRDRFVEGNVFTSTHAPRVRISVDGALRYVGQLHYANSDGEVERYLFADADEKRIARLFVVEVEAAGGLIEWEVDSTAREIEIGGERYRYSTRVFANAEQIRSRPAAAMARTTAFLEQHGLAVPAHLMSSFVARRAGADRSGVLAMHYFEDLERSGHAYGEVASGERFRPEHAELADALTERLLDSFEVLDR